MNDSTKQDTTNTLNNNNSTAKTEKPDPAFDPTKFSGAMTNPFCPFFPDLSALFGNSGND